MEQITEALNNIGFDLKLAIAHFVNFLIVFVILTKLVFKPLAARMRERNQEIEQGLNDAEKSRELLENAQEEKEKVLQEAQERKALLLSQAEQEAVERSREITERAEKDAQQKKEQAMQNFRKEAASLVARSAEKLSKLGTVTKEKANEVLHG